MGDPAELEKFENFLCRLETEIVAFCRRKSPTKGQDPILLFNWNDEGLQVRIPTAQHLRTATGAVVQTVQDMKDAIFHFLCSGNDAGTDLGNHHDIVQFSPAYCRDKKIEALLSVSQQSRLSASPRFWISSLTNQRGAMARYCGLLAGNHNNSCKCCSRAGGCAFLL